MSTWAASRRPPFSRQLPAAQLTFAGGVAGFAGIDAYSAHPLHNWTEDTAGTIGTVGFNVFSTAATIFIGGGAVRVAEGLEGAGAVGRIAGAAVKASKLTDPLFLAGKAIAGVSKAAKFLHGPTAADIARVGRSAEVAEGAGFAGINTKLHETGTHPTVPDGSTGHGKVDVPSAPKTEVGFGDTSAKEGGGSGHGGTGEKAGHHDSKAPEARTASPADQTHGAESGDGAAAGPSAGHPTVDADHSQHAGSSLSGDDGRQHLQDHPAWHDVHPADDHLDSTTNHLDPQQNHTITDRPALDAAMKKRDRFDSTFPKAVEARDKLAAQLHIDTKDLSRDNLPKTVRNLNEHAQTPADLDRIERLQNASQQVSDLRRERTRASEDLGTLGMEDWAKSDGQSIVLSDNGLPGQKGTFDGVGAKFEHSPTAGVDPRSPGYLDQHHVTEIDLNEAKGGNAAKPGVRTVDLGDARGEVEVEQGSGAYVNDIMHTDPRFLELLGDNPETARRLADGQIKVNANLTHTLRDGTIQVYRLVFNQSDLKLGDLAPWERAGH